MTARARLAAIQCPAHTDRVENFRLFPVLNRRWLVLAAVLFVLWIASTTELRQDMVAAGLPTIIAGSLPSFLAAMCCSAWIGGTQGTSRHVSAVMGAAVAASAELTQFVVAGVPDWADVLASGLGGLVAFGLLRAVERSA